MTSAITNELLYGSILPPGTSSALGGVVTTIDGALISGTIHAATALTLHDWIADANGLFHTTAKLADEWVRNYQQMLAGNGGSLTVVQRMEGNAEAIFENTGLAKLSVAQQTVDREDTQRELDTIAAGMAIDQAAYGIDPTKEFDTQSYITLEHTIQRNETLQELALQGHGLNTPPAIKYAGYTNDFQHNVDNRTLYIGGGNDNGKTAIADLYDDDIMTHVPFPTVSQNGDAIQRNQNDANEDVVQTSIQGMNQSAFERVYVAGDFSRTGATNGAQVTVAYAKSIVPTMTVAGAGEVTTLDGSVVSGAIVGRDQSQAALTPHSWVADVNGLYHTSTDLAAEWKSFYLTMLAGHGASLTAIQRLEGNAEAVFENTGLARLGAAQQQIDREDAQREMDAIAAAMTIDQTMLGIDPKAAFTKTTYMQLEHTLQSNEQLEELALQGHGLNNPPSTKYRGYTNDFQHTVDNATKYVGGGNDNGKTAIADLFDDDLMTHVPFATVARNGVLEQLNQNGAIEDKVEISVGGMNQSLYERVYVAADFSRNGADHGPEIAVATNPANSSVTTLDGTQIAAVIGPSLTQHAWIADDNGLFHTTTNLAAEWRADLAIVRAGHGGTLTAIQRLEANAEVVFENTGLAKLSAIQQQVDREDVQREFDAMWAAMQIDAATLGIKADAQFTQSSYLALEKTLQANETLEELAIQGHGLNHPPAARYSGYTNDFQNNVDNTTLFVGGGLNSGKTAIADFFDDNIMSHVPFATVMRNGQLVQLNQNGSPENTIQQAMTALNDAMFNRIYTSADFQVPPPVASSASVKPATVVKITK